MLVYLVLALQILTILKTIIALINNILNAFLACNVQWQQINSSIGVKQRRELSCKLLYPALVLLLYLCSFSHFLDKFSDVFLIRN